MLWILRQRKYLCHETTLVVGTVGDSLNSAVRQVHLVAALHLPQVVLGLSLGEGVPTVVILHSILVLERLGRQLFDGGRSISSLPLFQRLLLFPVNGGLLPRVVLGHLFPVDRRLVGIPSRGSLGPIRSRALLLLTPLRGT